MSSDRCADRLVYERELLPALQMVEVFKMPLPP